METSDNEIIFNWITKGIYPPNDWKVPLKYRPKKDLVLYKGMVSNNPIPNILNFDKLSSWTKDPLIAYNFSMYDVVGGKSTTQYGVVVELKIPRNLILADISNYRRNGRKKIDVEKILFYLSKFQKELEKKPILKKIPGFFGSNYTDPIEIKYIDAPFLSDQKEVIVKPLKNIKAKIVFCRKRAITMID